MGLLGGASATTDIVTRQSHSRVEHLAFGRPAAEGGDAVGRLVQEEVHGPRGQQPHEQRDDLVRVGVGVRIRVRVRVVRVRVRFRVRVRARGRGSARKG